MDIDQFQKYEDQFKKMKLMIEKQSEVVDLMNMCLKMLLRIQKCYPHIFWECITREELEKLLKGAEDAKFRGN